MSVWEFYVALQGYSDAHCPDDPNATPAGELDELWTWLQEKEGPVH